MISIEVNKTVDVIELEPFFDGWKWDPTPEARRALLERSTFVVSARENGRLIGLATLLSDGAFFAYLSFLEVVSDYQGKGVGTMLINRAIELVSHQYDLATITDPPIVKFYERAGFRHDVSGVHLRFR